MSKDLRQFLQQVKDAGSDYYVEIKKPLNPELGKGVIQAKLAHEGRFPVVYCPKTQGSSLPLVSNLFGSYELLGMAMGLDPKIATKADILREYRNREGLGKPTVTIPASKAPVKEVIIRGSEIDLSILPINKHSEGDSGKYISIGNMITKNPDTGLLNVGVYRHEVKGKDQLGFQTVPGHHAYYIVKRHAALNKPMEVAIFLGHHPAVVLGTLYAGSLGTNELEIAGGILGEPLEVTPAETVDLPVPARAEIVIEGVIDPNHMVTDGPLGEWDGYYGGHRECYILQVKCITMRHDAIFHDLAVAQREHTLATVLGNTSGVYQAVKKLVPTMKEVFLSFSGASGMIAYISIAQRVSGEANRAGLAAAITLAPSRMIVVVDDDVNVFNEEEVLWAVASRSTPDLDITVLPRVLGLPGSPSSYDETRLKAGHMISKLIIDATRPVGQPFAARVVPPKELWGSMKLEDYLK